MVYENFFFVQGKVKQEALLSLTNRERQHQPMQSRVFLVRQDRLLPSGLRDIFLSSTLYRSQPGSFTPPPTHNLA